MDEKITLENLAGKMDEGFKNMDEGFKRVDGKFDGVDGKFKEAEKHTDKKIDEKIDGLALAVAKGFEGIDKRFDENAKQHQRFLDKFENLGQGQEDIKLKLDNVAYRFEIVDLDKRLKKLEVKLGIA